MASLLSTLYWLLVAAIALVMFPVALLLWAITAPFDRRRVVLHAFTNVWGAAYTWINPLWSVRVRGREHIEPGQIYVMVANHLSMVDIFAIHRLHRHFKWVSKAEVFEIPCIGWNMHLVGYVPLRRGDPQSVAQMFERCRQVLREGSSVMMFPEGTRSRTGEMKAWKPGAFELAKQADVALLPIAIQGTSTALPAGGLGVARARMRVTVLEPVPVEEVRGSSVEALRERLRERVARFLESEPWPPA